MGWVWRWGRGRILFIHRVFLVGFFGGYTGIVSNYNNINFKICVTKIIKIKKVSH